MPELVDAIFAGTDRLLEDLAQMDQALADHGAGYRPMD